MSLINCPECNKEISNQCNICPNCGFKISKESNEDLISKPPNLEIPKLEAKKSWSFKNLSRKKLIALISSIVFVILLLSSIGFVIYNKNIQNNKLLEIQNNKLLEYRKNIDLVQYEMTSSGDKAIALLSLTSDVWRNAIYQTDDLETNKYTKPDGYFVSDFNTALSNLDEDLSVVNAKKSISESQVIVSDIMKKLQNPPESYGTIYEALLEESTSYKTLTDLAINIEGSLNTFSQNVEVKKSDFLDARNKVQYLIPD